MQMQGKCFPSYQQGQSSIRCAWPDPDDGSYGYSDNELMWQRNECSDINQSFARSPNCFGHPEANADGSAIINIINIRGSSTPVTSAAPHCYKKRLSILTLFLSYLRQENAEGTISDFSLEYISHELKERQSARKKRKKKLWRVAAINEVRASTHIDYPYEKPNADSGGHIQHTGQIKNSSGLGNGSKLNPWAPVFVSTVSPEKHAAD
eukprot:Filipodium_phascolosomae@DN1487_c0_g1_i1.p1